MNAQSQWQKTIGGTGDDEARSIIQAADGSFLIAGFTNSFGAGNNDFNIVRLNSSGSVLWTKTIGEAGNDFATSIIQTTDNGYATTGYTVPYGTSYYNMVIVKLDSYGSIQWSRSIDRSNYEYATSIKQTSDSGYILAGMSATGGVFTSDMFIVKLNSSGTYQWSKTYGGSGDEPALSIIQTTDGGFVFAGYSNSYSAFHVFYILKTDSIGNLQWCRLIGQSGTGSVVYSIIQTSDGGIALAGGFTPTGTGNYDMYIVKLNSSGSIQWTRTVGGTGDDNANSITQTSDGGFVIGGYTNSYGAGNYDMYIVKLNNSGTLLWSRTVGGTGDDRNQSIIKTADGGLIAAGYTESFGAGAKDIFIVKFDAGGNTCGNSTSPSSLYGVSGTSTSPTVSVVTENPTVTTPTSISGTGGILTNICIAGIQPISNETPASYELYQNYPNPFNPVSKIKFDIAEAGNAKLIIYNIMGQKILLLADQNLNPGSYEAEFNGANYPSGVYFYKLETPSFVETKKMVLIK